MRDHAPSASLQSIVAWSRIIWRRSDARRLALFRLLASPLQFFGFIFNNYFEAAIFGFEMLGFSISLGKHIIYM